MGTNKIGLYNCVFLCFILWQPAQFKRKNDLPLRYNNITETCDLQKNFLIFELLSIFSSFLPSIFHSIFVSMRGSKRDEIHSNMKGRRFLFFSRISVNRLYISARIFNQLQKNHTHRRRSIRYESITRQSFITFYLYSYVFIFKIFIPYVYTSFFPCDSNLFPISLSFNNIYIYIHI